MTFKSYFEHSEPLFNDLQILDLYKINSYLTCLFMFRYYNLQNLPEMFENYFSKNNEFHSYNTRSSSLLHKTYKRTNYTKHSLACKGIDVWNGLDNHYKKTGSYSTFKTKIKKYFLQINSVT